MNDLENRVKGILESAFDIPFTVKMNGSAIDPVFLVCPDNPDASLFQLEFSFRQKTRIVIQVQPQKYAASLLDEMASASETKKRDFSIFAGELIGRKKANVKLLINNKDADPCIPEAWPDKWSNLYARISKSPVIGETEQFNATELVCDWAVPVAGMFLSLLSIVPVDDTLQAAKIEGAKSSVLVNKYERNPINRQLCVTANGYACRICGMSFSDVYGPLGSNFIHVHHIIPVSAMKEAYIIDPVHDLIPVCPNCHAMLHRTEPPLDPAQLKKILEEKR